VLYDTIQVHLYNAFTGIGHILNLEAVECGGSRRIERAVRRGETETLSGTYTALVYDAHLLGLESTVTPSEVDYSLL